MDYQSEIGSVARARIDEIRGDLDQARHALSRAVLHKDQLERQVASLEALLELADEGEREDSAPQGLTCHQAMAIVLQGAPAGMMRAGDLAAEINRRDQGASTRHADERLALPRPPIRKTSSTVEELPEGKANLIRASFNAGLKPATIARTYHVSQSLVHRVIKSADKPGR